MRLLMPPRTLARSMRTSAQSVFAGEGALDGVNLTPDALSAGEEFLVLAVGPRSVSDSVSLV